MIQNMSKINFLVGLISIAKIDDKVIKEFELLKNFYLEKVKDSEKIAFISELFTKEFDANLANKEFNKEQKELFFNLALMIAFLDGLSEKEEAFIRVYAKALEYPNEKLDEIIKSLTFETSKNLDFDLLYWFNRMLKGYINYINTGITKFDAYYSFRLLHFLTNNRMNQFMVFLAEVFNSYESTIDKQVLGNNISEVVTSINERGYFVFKDKISSELVDKLSDFALKTPSYPIYSDKKFSECFESEGVLFKNIEPNSTRYEYSLKDLLNNQDIFQVLLENDFTEIARQLFNSKSLLSTFHMWWTTPVKDERDRYTGQAFHIDIDRSGAILFIIYLSDVDEDNGPHIFVKGSHKNKPHHLLQDRRMSEKELIEYYSKENLVKIIAEKGSVIAIDALGFHRGQPLNKGDRLALKYEFSVDGFGEMLPYMKVEKEESKKLVEELAKKYNYTFSKLV